MLQHLVLHVGLHKTATTALQGRLAGLAPQLARHGVACPSLETVRDQLSPLLCSQRPVRRQALRRQLSAPPQPVLLVSDENLFGVPRDVVEGALYPWAETRVRTLAEELGDTALTVVVTLRSPASFLPSLYGEYLRANDWLSFDDWAAPLDVTGFSWTKRLGWLTALPENVRVHVIPFEPGLEGGPARVERCLLDAVLPAVDLPLPPWSDEPRSRRMFSAEEMGEASRLAEAAGPAVASAFLQMLDERGLRFGSTRWRALADATARALDELYVADLDWFGSRLLNDATPPA